MMPYSGAGLGGAGAPQPGGAQAAARSSTEQQAIAQAMAAQQGRHAASLSVVLAARFSIYLSIYLLS